MKDVNKVILIGRLGSNPVLRQTKAGLAVAQFSLATAWRTMRRAESSASSEAAGEELRVQGLAGEEDPGRAEQTQWHQIVAWGKQGEACAQYLRKGHSAYIEGSLRSRKYTAKDGSLRTVFEVHAECVSFLGKGSASGSSDMVESLDAIRLAASA